MADHAIRPLSFDPGIQRDGTKFDTNSCIDGQWVRFYKGKPRKIGGYKLIDPGTTEIIRDMFYVQRESGIDIYYGRPSSLIVANFDEAGNLRTLTDRTPTDPTFSPNVNNSWDFELVTEIDGGVSTTYIVATACPNAGDINNRTEGGIFYGNITSISPLEPLTTPDNQLTSGGICLIGDYLFKFGNNGVVNWSDNGDISNWPTVNSNAAATTKIVQGYETRGGNTVSGLFWSLDSLIRATYASIQGSDENHFDFVTIQPNISILSPKTIVKYTEDIFFWVGVNKFFMYNGIVQSLSNTFSTNFFFENLNINAKEKVWSMIISTTTSNEWWIFFPYGTSTECNHAIIYNIDDQCWYDTPINRSAGIQATVNFAFPVMADSQTMVDPKNPPPEGSLPFEIYGVWMHEFGYDKQMYQDSFAIASYFETNIMTYFEQDPTNDRDLRAIWIEPDFVMVGNMNVIARKRAYAQSEVIESPIRSFGGSTGKVDMHDMGGLVSLKFISNEREGFYQMGKVLMAYAPGDLRRGA